MLFSYAQLFISRNSKTLFSPKSRPLLFIAGGIGITPFFPIVASWIEQSDKKDLALLWSARTESDLFDKERFEVLQKQESHFTFFPVTTLGASAEQAPHQKIRMLIESVIDKKGSDDLNVFFCGPHVMRRELFALFIDRG